MGKKKASDSTSQETSNISRSAHVAGTICLFSTTGTNWIVDSGATDHMCHDLDVFSSYTEIIDKTSTITIPNGKHVSITHRGTVHLSNDIVLTEVLYVHEFKFNLVSIPKICKDLKCDVMFNDLGCFLQGPSLRPLLLGKLKNGLYYLENSLSIHHDSPSTPPSLANNVSSSSSTSQITTKTKLWHLRMGHMSVDYMSYIKDIFDNEKCSLGEICQICPAANQSRGSFQSSSIKSTTKFQLVHIDTWGPYRESTSGGCRFFVTIVDDYTRMTWVFLIQQKSDIVKIFQNFFIYVKNQFQTSIQGIRSENAPEFCEGEYKKFGCSHGIIHQKTCPYTPQQNGVVERKHRHILEFSRALFFQSKVRIHL